MASLIRYQIGNKAKANIPLQVPVVQPEGLAPVKGLLEKLEKENGGRLPGQLSRWATSTL